MQTLFKAGAAFALAALFHGAQPSPDPRWQAVAEEIHQSQPREQVRLQVQAALRALLFQPVTQDEKG